MPPSGSEPAVSERVAVAEAPPSARPDRVPEAYWALAPEALMAALGSAPGGLTTAQAEAVHRRCGPNALAPVDRRGALRVLLAQLRSPLVLVLLAASAVACILGDIEDAVIIWGIVLASCGLSFTQEYRASRAMDALRSRLARTAGVLRDGAERRVSVEEVVPGDVLCLAAGDLVAADAVMMTASDVEVGQAILTGEAFPAAKETAPSPADAPLAARTNVVFSGTSVRSGFGRAIVVRTGSSTAFARIAATLERQEEETEFAVGIRRFGSMMMEIVLVLIMVVLVVNLAQHRPAIEALLFGLALAVGLTPELLPAIVTITLADGARAMQRHGVIVRRLAAIENLGSMDILCTDKTGTLTSGVIRLDAALDGAAEASARVMLLATLNATMQTGLPNPLDEAIRASATLASSALHGWSKVDEIPYDFARKRLSVVCRKGDAPLDVMVTKGALASVLAVCTAIERAGSVVPLSDADRAAIDGRLRAWSEAGLRALGVATREFSPRGRYGRADECDLVLAGFLLFEDTPKPDAADTLAALLRHGIATKILTGDNRHAAHHLAEGVGMRSARLTSGAEIARMSDDALFARAERSDVFCELDPDQKERIVRALRRRGHVVGYLGDGINDAPALTAADVGISVDGAVDVAREAADIVLLSKDLGILCTGVADGRRTFANTMKYIFIATSANFGNMLSMAAASLVLPFLPMLAKQILLNNFLADLPALALAGDAVEADRLTRPLRWDIGAIRRFMIIFGLVSSLFDLVTFGFLLRVVHADAAHFQTGWFVESLLTQCLAIVLVRTARPAWRSRPSHAVALLCLAVAAAAVALPGLPVAPALGFVPLEAQIVLGLAAITLGYGVALEGAKHFFYARPGVDQSRSSLRIRRA